MPALPTISTSRFGALSSQLYSEDRSPRRCSMPVTAQNTRIRHASATCCDKAGCPDIDVTGTTTRTNIGTGDGRRRITSVEYRPRSNTIAWPRPATPPPSAISMFTASPVGSGDVKRTRFVQPASLAPPPPLSSPRPARVVGIDGPSSGWFPLLPELPDVIVMLPDEVGPDGASLGRESTHALDAHTTRNMKEIEHQERCMRGQSVEKEVTLTLSYIIWMLIEKLIWGSVHMLMG